MSAPKTEPNRPPEQPVQGPTHSTPKVEQPQPKPLEKKQ